MKWYWTIPISIAIIGYFGIFWTLSLSNIEVSFKMDNNTRDAIESIDYKAIANKEVWNCPILLEQGRYVFTDGILISPSGEELKCVLVATGEGVKNG